MSLRSHKLLACELPPALFAATSWQLLATFCRNPFLDLFYILTVLTFAGLMQGLTGFGFGIVAMALLPLWMDFKLAAATVAAINIPVCWGTLWSNRKHFAWRDSAGLIAGVVVGAPIGVSLLSWGRSETLLRGLGGVMCLFALIDPLLQGFRLGPIPRWCALPLGFVSGIFGGAFNIGGPPAVAYVYSQAWSKQQRIAALQAMFSISGILRVALMGNVGLLGWNVAFVFVSSLIPVMAGILLGGLLLNRAAQSHLKVGVLLIVFVMGLKYLFWPPAMANNREILDLTTQFSQILKNRVALPRS